jgi:hypothetical protein
MRVCDGGERPGALVGCAPRVRPAARPGPRSALVGIGHHVCHQKGAPRSPALLGRPGTKAPRGRPVRGGGGLDQEARETGQGGRPYCRAKECLNEAKDRLPWRCAQTQRPTPQNGQECGRMVSHELEQEDSLSGVCLGVALRAYADILWCAMWALHKIRQTPVTNTKSTLNVTVGTVKKSQETSSLT